MGHDALRDKATTVADNADCLAVAGKQGMRSIAHIDACSGIRGQHTALGELVVD